jgi:hypothetical protein
VKIKKGKFYEEEIQKVVKTNDISEIEKVVKTGKRGGKVEYFVKRKRLSRQIQQLGHGRVEQ